MDRNIDYEKLVAQLEALTLDVPYETANLANAAALIWQELPDINWAGFYKMIPVGRGVCGTAVAENKTRLVYDVHQFPGHIACDCASNSEIVIPIRVKGEIWGVLDIDSPYVGRFTEADRTGLEGAAAVLEKVLE